MAEPKRILIAGLTAETGGMESYIMNLYRHTDRSRLQFDFINQNPVKDLAFSDEITAMGGRIYRVPYLRDGFFEHYKSLKRVFGDTEYEAIYYQSNRQLKNADLFRYAKKYNVRRRILHSHNSGELGVGKIGRLRIKMTEPKLKKLLTDCFACSEEAGKWMFSWTDNVTVIKNGVDTTVFDYHPETGERIREENGAGGKKIFGTVGRISKEKNPLFLADLFAEIHKKNPDTIFFHIGGGDMEEDLRKRILEKDLKDSYILLGRKDNVSDYLNAMDLLLLPSVHEGFPITLVEAQCSGMHCLVSDKITETVNITGNVYFKSIEEDAEKWAVDALAASEYERHSCRDILTEKGFDEQSIADRFTEFVLK